MLPNMAFEQCTEPGRRMSLSLPCGKAATGPPVIAENEVRLQADEQKWYHGSYTRLLLREGGFLCVTGNTLCSAHEVPNPTKGNINGLIYFTHRKGKAEWKRKSFI